MDGLTATIERGGFLPLQAPLAMAPARLGKPSAKGRARVSLALALRRSLILVGTALLTAAGAYEMYKVVDVGEVTTLEWALLGLFVALFAWVAFSFLSALIGFFVLLARADSGLSLDLAGPPPALASQTAMLLPTYNEDPHLVTARLAAMIESVEATGRSEHFAWFLLSDTTDPDIWIAEEAAFVALQERSRSRAYYRHRAQNLARKSGNIADWVERWGAAFDHFLILDADSLMSGDTIVRLAHAMETHPEAALIQSAPVVVNAQSLFGRLQQFAGRLYGPLAIAGAAWWQGPESNYWGHNAIIRTRAFAEEAALPELPGRKPFGGHILSHDFIEAAFMRRAGWAIYTAPYLGGSYEEAPPSLIDFAARDRRWCQGNLQHLVILPARGLRWVSRLHLAVGVGAYLTAPMWFAFLILGLAISLQAAFVRPEYFPQGFSLFPAWPQQDPVRAAWVFAATMGLLLLPKLLAYVALLFRPAERRAFGGGLRALAGLLAETALAVLIAPAMMVFQSRGVAEILIGRDAGWQVQRRDDGAVPRAEIARKLLPPTLVGVAMALAAYSISLPLLLWMSPVLLGLILAIPMGLLTSLRLPSPGPFATPEDLNSPPVVERARDLARAPRPPAVTALTCLRDDAELLAQHLAMLGPTQPGKRAKIDVALATARAKLEASHDFAEVADWLDGPETRALLGDRELLPRALQL
jgi:membrane glycosyltransferase